MSLDPQPGFLTISRELQRTSNRKLERRAKLLARAQEIVELTRRQVARTRQLLNDSKKRRQLSRGCESTSLNPNHDLSTTISPATNSKSIRLGCERPASSAGDVEVAARSWQV